MISECASANFDTLVRAAKNGDLALLECLDTVTRLPVAMIVAIQPDRESDDGVEFVPFAVMTDDNPYVRYLPPDENGGYREVEP